MLQALFERCFVAAALPFGLRNRLKCDDFTVVLQILIEKHGVVAFLLRLNSVPVFKTVQTDGGVVICKVKIEIRGIKLFVNLLVNKF